MEMNQTVILYVCWFYCRFCKQCRHIAQQKKLFDKTCTAVGNYTTTTTITKLLNKMNLDDLNCSLNCDFINQFCCCIFNGKMQFENSILEIKFIKHIQSIFMVVKAGMISFNLVS